MGDIDIGRLRLVPQPSTNGNAPKPPRPRRTGGKFVKGPLPVPWLAVAARLPGRALHVAVVIWFRKGIERRDAFRLPAADLDLFGIQRFTGYRALNALERAGLIAVRRHRGRCPHVTVLPVPDASEG